MGQKIFQSTIWVVSITLLSLIATTASTYIPGTECVTVTLEPCKKHPALPSSILCQNIDDIRTFMRVIKCGSKKNMQEIFLEQSSIDYLPLYTLDYWGFLFLNVKSVVLSKLLEGNERIRLQQLHLNNITINGHWDWSPLAVLVKLVRFSVSSVVVKTLDRSLVDYLSPKLQSFILTSTNTSSIEENALAKFSDLVYLSILDCEISELKRNMFPRPAKIKYFYFGKNKLSNLPADLFHDMPDLEVIGLQGNLIPEIHEATFKMVLSKLSNVFLEGNPLKCHCKMLWLVKKGTPAVFKGECYSPKKEYGRHLVHLRPSDFRCI